LNNTILAISFLGVDGTGRRKATSKSGTKERFADGMVKRGKILMIKAEHFTW
jgi:hypothetical protein